MQPAEDHPVCARRSWRGARLSTAMRRSRCFRPLGETGGEVLLNNIPFDCTTPAPAPVPALDARGIAFALLVLLGVAALGFRRRRDPDFEA